MQTTLQRGMFHDESLFYHKAIRNTLTEDQLTRYDEYNNSRRAYHHKASIRLAVALSNTTSRFATRDGERRQRCAGKKSSAAQVDGLRLQYILFHMDRLARMGWRRLFDDMQWKLVSRLLSKYKANRQFLRQQGLLGKIDNEIVEIENRRPPKK